jgi:hypothetical protein
MPTFSRSLEQSLHRALALANERHHEYATLEHLLLALIDDNDAAAVMRACNVDLDVLRRNLVEYIDTELAKELGGETWGYRRLATFGGYASARSGRRDRCQKVDFGDKKCKTGDGCKPLPFFMYPFGLRRPESSVRPCRGRCRLACSLDRADADRSFRGWCGP